MNDLIRETFEKGEGIFRMIPALIPVKFGLPGRRLKLHPDDYYAFGAVVAPRTPNGRIKA